jgi:hypothetical protein
MSRRSLSTPSTTPRVQVPQHVARLVSASHRLVVDYFASRRLVVDYFASRRLVVDYFAYAARPVTRLVAPLVVDYFVYAVRPGASTRRVTRC